MNAFLTTLLSPFWLQVLYSTTVLLIFILFEKFFAKYIFSYLTIIVDKSATHFDNKFLLAI